MRWRKRVPLVRQTTTTDCGAACLTMLLHFWGNNIPLHQVSKMCGASRNGVTIKDIIKVGERNGLECLAFRADKSRFYEEFRNDTPVIALMSKYHFVVVDKVGNRNVSVLDPEDGRKEVEKESFLREFSGIFIVANPTKNFKLQNNNSENKTRILRENFSDTACFWWGMLVTAAVQGCGICIPLLIRHVVDNVYNIQAFEFILSGLVVISLYSALTYIKNSQIIKISYNLWEKLLDYIIKKLFRAKLSFFDTRSTGDIVNRINNINSIKDIVIRIANSIVIDSFSLIIFGTVMVIISPSLFCVVLANATVQVFFFCISRNRIRELTKIIVSDQENTSTYLLDVLQNMVIVKGAEYKNDVYRKWRDLLSKQKRDGVEKDRFSNLFQSILMGLKLMPTVSLLGVGAILVSEGTLTLGDLMAYVSLSSFFIEPLISIFYNANEIELVNTVIGRVMEIYYSDDEQTGNLPVGGRINTITAQNVAFEYSSSEKNILDDVSFSVKLGDKVAFVGKTGSGKSTIVKLLLGLYSARNGHVLINSHNIEKINIEEYRQQIGVVLQDTYFFDTSIRDNIDISNSYSIEQVKKAAQLAELDCDIEKMPMGYDTIVGENGKNLSGGQRQRIAIARALLKMPDVVIFDEGTNQLDALTERKIYQNLREASMTQIVISHRLSTVKDSDFIYFLDKGRIVEQGTHMDLINLNCKYAHAWAEQN